MCVQNRVNLGRAIGIFDEILRISISFIYRTLKEILAALDDKLNNADLDGIIAEIDTDGSGTVDFDGELVFSIYFFFKSESIHFSQSIIHDERFR